VIVKTEAKHRIEVESRERFENIAADEPEPIRRHAIDIERLDSVGNEVSAWLDPRDIACSSIQGGIGPTTIVTCDVEYAFAVYPAPAVFDNRLISAVEPVRERAGGAGLEKAVVPVEKIHGLPGAVGFSGIPECSS
jgi:hypothetical protein